MPNIIKQSTKKYHVVYQTTNNINNMIYIGAHSTDDVNDNYLGSGFRLSLAIEKYGVNSFSKSIMHIFDNPEDMFKKEAEIVNEDFLSRTDVYNIVCGGFGGYNKGTTGLKHLHHKGTGKGCAVHPRVIPQMIKEGWSLGRKSSSTKDTVWIHNDRDKKMVNRKNLKFFLDMGWRKGLPESPTKGKIWIYNHKLDEYSVCDSNDLEIKYQEGWTKKKWAPIKKGTKWINNGYKNLRIDKDEFEDYKLIGWTAGMIKSQK